MPIGPKDAVRNGISASASDAVELNVVDLQARDVEDLLGKIDGREVTLTQDRKVELRTAQARVVYNNTNFIEDFLNIIANPNIAFLLLSFGSLGIFIEFLHPGAIFPGVFGVISLLTGFFALSVLPFNWAGVALILFAFLLFALELFMTSGGILGIGASSPSFWAGCCSRRITHQASLCRHGSCSALLQCWRSWSHSCSQTSCGSGTCPRKSESRP